MTGRNHHSVGMGFLTDLPIGFPGYTARIPHSAATMPRILRDNGYSTFAVGKWHLTPRWELSASGPFDRWPLGLGFERFYGFLAGDTNQWTPELVCDNGFVDPPSTPDEGYHLTEDLADRAIRLVQDQQQATPDKPFMLWFATGAQHAPHQAPREWIDKYAGRFDDGWEAWRDRVFARQMALGVVPAATELPERPSWVPEWESLPAEQQRLFARMMEVFAGFLSHTDEQIGRLVSFLEETGALDDTILILVSDNGTSAEGGPLGTLNEHRFTHDMEDDPADTLEHIDELGGFRAYNHYPWGWAWAGNTPFRLWKRYSWLGGVRTPLIVHWPGGIEGRGEVREQFCHAIDVLPTILDVLGIEPPASVAGAKQQRIDGATLRGTFADATAPSPRSTQYFEMLGSRAIYHDGWRATTDHIGHQMSVELRLLEGSKAFDDDHWALFDLSSDFAEARDVGDAHPEVLAQLIERWWDEARNNSVLPLDDSFIGRTVALEPSPWGARARATLRPGGGGVAEDLLPPLGGGFTLEADVEIADDGAEGIVVALGDWSNGFAFYLIDGVPVVAFNLFGSVHRAAAESPVAAGRHRVGFEYRRERSGGGPVTVTVDGAVVARMELPRDLPFRWQIGGAGLVVGRDKGFPVCDDYEPPFGFTGVLHTVSVESHALLARTRGTQSTPHFDTSSPRPHHRRRPTQRTSVDRPQYVWSIDARRVWCGDEGEACYCVVAPLHWVEASVSRSPVIICGA
ncbi:MAG: arylsulfatase [Acidimicrobiia bacterium]|nr:arylsulfatase [Acidimicrobiia bacterium]